MDEGQIALLLRDGDTGLPAYSDTGYSDIPATVTVFRSIKKDLLILKIPATVTFCLQ